MRRKPLVAAMLALLAVALVLGGNALLDAGWGPALRSVADRVLPNPEVAMWAPAPDPGSHASSYADATGAGANYVYLVEIPRLVLPVSFPIVFADDVFAFLL